MLSPDVQVIILDARKGYLGKEQSKWISGVLQRSQALWKIIVYAPAFGVKSFEVASPSDPVDADGYLDGFDNGKELDLSIVGTSLLGTAEEDGQKPGVIVNENVISVSQEGAATAVASPVDGSSTPARGVSMMLPDPETHDEVDEDGRPKSR